MVNEYMINTDLFENIDSCDKVLFGFLDELLAENEALDNLDDKEDWDLDDFLIATIQFMDFVYQAKWDFVVHYRL